MRHIVVTGASGAGKTTVAAVVACRFGLPVCHLDDNPLWRAFLDGKSESHYAELCATRPETHEAYAAARRAAFADALSRLSEPHVVEGSQALSCPDLLTNHLVLLLYLPPSVNVRQCLERDKRVGRFLDYKDPRFGDRCELARRLYLQDGRRMVELADVGPDRDVWTLNDLNDVSIATDVMLPLALSRRSLAA